MVAPLWAELSHKEAGECLEKCMVYMEQGYTDLALKEMEEAVRLEPSGIDGHRCLAVAYSLRLKFIEAIKQYEAIFQINPEIKEMPVHCPWLKKDKENEKILQDLEEGLKKAHETQPQNFMVHALLGWLYGEEGRLRDAYLELLRAAEKAPSPAERKKLALDDKVVATLTWELAMAMKSSHTLARTQLSLLLFALK